VQKTGKRPFASSQKKSAARTFDRAIFQRCRGGVTDCCDFISVKPLSVRPREQYGR